VNIITKNRKWKNTRLQNYRGNTNEITELETKKLQRDKGI
jgi:hypothetical protein